MRNLRSPGRAWPQILLCLSASAAALLSAPAGAEVERIEITVREDVAGGQAFGLAGPYEKLAGTVLFAVDPDHATNRRIVDLDRAPRDDDGRVRFSADLYMLRPVDPGRGNGALFLEVPNRGGKAIVRYFHRGAGRSRDPVTDDAVGDGFLLHRGFTLVWVGWQWDVPDNPELLRLHPAFAAADPTLEGLVRADHVFPEDAQVFALGNRNHRAYPVADPGDPRNVLTVRDTRLGERRVIRRKRWRFARLEDGRVVADPRSIYYRKGFKAGRIYEAVYVAREPAVVGLGLAAVRDLVSFLKHDEASPAPVDRALGMGISQTGRFLRHFLYQGFNRDAAGRRVFDGLLVHTAGAGRGSFNHRFGQPSRDAHPFSAFFYPTDIFPFTGEVQKDPVSGLEDGLFRVLREAGEDALPKIFFTNSGYEYWGRAAALIHASVDGGSDSPLAGDERIYHFASTQHFVDRFPPERRDTRYRANSASFFWALRALLVALDAWVEVGTEPPVSRHPRLADGTLVPLRELAFPAVPGVEVPRQAHEAYRVDYGPRFRSQGIVDRQPPAIGRAFPVLVAQVDADGNELGGLRLPEVAVPLATYTPWNWRSAEIGSPGELADFRGSFFPFAATRVARQAGADPRPSLEERYGSREAYLGGYAEAAVALVRERYLLAEDVPEMLEHAARLWQEVTASGGPPGD